MESETQSILILKNVTSSDQGTYKCIGKNSLGSEKMEYQIDVLEPAKIADFTEDIKVVLPNFDPITIYCEARGTPLPVLSIIFEGKLISSTSKFNITKLFDVHNNSSVYFEKRANGISFLDPFKIQEDYSLKSYTKLSKLGRNVLRMELVFQYPDRDVSGKYQCMTYNAVGRDEKSIDVKIYGK